jgi:hypothetical protein
MLFDDDFVSTINDDPVKSARQVCERALQAVENGTGWSRHEYDYLLESYALLQTLIEAQLLKIAHKPLILTGTVEEDCPQMFGYIREVKAKLDVMTAHSSLDKLKARFAHGLKSGFAYEFSQADLQRIQQLINELRDQVANSQVFDEQHRTRLMKRLENLQREVHKRVSDLDRFWGLIGDAGVALGRFGKDAKPIVDRISEIAQIVWHTQAQTEGLPSTTDMPLLNNNSSSQPE